MLSNKSKVERRRPIYPCTQLVGGILVTRGAENNLVLEMTQPEGEIILKMIKQQDEMEEERMMKQQNEKVEEEEEEEVQILVVVANTPERPWRTDVEKGFV